MRKEGAVAVECHALRRKGMREMTKAILSAVATLTLLSGGANSSSYATEPVKPVTQVAKPPMPCADLTVTSVTVNPQTPTTTTNIQFNVVIRNIGGLAAPPSEAAIRVGGETNPKLFNVPGLQPGQTATISRTETLTVAQRYRTTAYADYTQKVSECNEGNNSRYVEFNVRKFVLQVVYPNTNQQFATQNNKFTMTVEFNGPAQQSSVVPSVSFKMNYPKDANAAGTIQWLNDKKFVWTSTKDKGDLCTWTPDCPFSMMITDAVKDTSGEKLDGDKDGNPGGSFNLAFRWIG